MKRMVDKKQEASEAQTKKACKKIGVVYTPPHPNESKEERKERLKAMLRLRNAMRKKRKWHNMTEAEKEVFNAKRRLHDALAGGVTAVKCWYAALVVGIPRGLLLYLRADPSNKSARRTSTL